MNTKLVATQVSLQNWMITFRDRQISGLTIKEYCTQCGLSKNAYYYWLRKARKAALEENEFVEISRSWKYPKDCVNLQTDIVKIS